MDNSNKESSKNASDEEIPTIQVGSEDSPFEEDLEGDEIPF
ncbi:MAG TPA: hypothetical protein P5052_00735 [Candidatus Paceibacterota bacterium]|jgi:hypothetical protein|nr:hypothetical protein [Candidatus Paceibacterota bacterium]HRZ29318.1 hypothetical protein [Candidatus Paceibacterota bacterium]